MSRNRRRPTDEQSELTRRDLFRRAACAGVGMIASASMVRDLRMINAAAADGLPAAPADYKALICIFMNGGNDANNLIVQTDDVPATENYGYNAYAAARGVLAIPKTGDPATGLIPLTGRAGNAVLNDGHSYGLHPSCPHLAAMFNSPTSNLAVLCNVGTLLYPITSVQFNRRGGRLIKVPSQLFSHQDQVVQWQTSLSDRDSRTGWGGRMADLLHSTYNDQATVSMSVAISNACTFEVGDAVNQYVVGTSGPPGLAGGTSGETFNLNQRLKALKDFSLTPATPTTPQANLYEVGYATATDRAVKNFEQMNGAISPTADPSSTVQFWTVPFPNTTLGRQLKMVARMIAGRKVLKHSRQVFFCSVGGYDLHSGQNNGSPLTGAHANLLSEVSRCIHAFNSAMNQLRSSGNATIAMTAADSVVGFTASDFGRTFPVNGTTGSDHGWGNHHLIFGDGVVGGRLYGTFPSYAINRQPNQGIGAGDDTDTGRWIPTLSVDQYAATLAKWFGVPETNLPTIFPNLPRFNTQDLGFFNAPPAASPLPTDRVTASAQPSTPVSPISKPTPTKPKPAPRPTMRKQD
jgi:uncharacterized protein (DUF1501 family)